MTTRPKNPAPSSDTRGIRAEIDRLKDRLGNVESTLEDHGDARRAFDDALYGKGEKEDKDKAVFPRLASLERDRTLLRWLIALLGGVGFTAFQKYLPWLKKD